MKPATTTTATATTPPGLAYFIYGILFLMVVAIGGNENVELFSLSIFFVTNLFFTITLEKDIISRLTTSTINLNSIYDVISPFFVSISLILEFVSSILLVMTMNYLKKKFETEESNQLELQTTIRENLNNTKILFILATLSIALSALGVFNDSSAFSLDSFFKLIGGSSKYMMEFVLGTCVFIFVLSSYILWKLNNASSSSGNIPGFKDFVNDYRALYSIAAIYVLYIPFRILTRYAGWFNVGGIQLDWAIPALNACLIALAAFFSIKLGVDGTKVFGNAPAAFKEKIKENSGVFVALFILGLVGLMMMPDWAINAFIKIVLPVMSFGITAYLLKRMVEMATLNNKIVVR